MSAPTLKKNRPEGGFLRCPPPERSSLDGDWRRHSSLREGGKLEHSRHTGTIGLYRLLCETRESAESCPDLPFFAILQGCTGAYKFPPVRYKPFPAAFTCQSFPRAATAAAQSASHGNILTVQSGSSTAGSSVSMWALSALG